MCSNPHAVYFITDFDFALTACGRLFSAPRITARTDDIRPDHNILPAPVMSIIISCV